MDFDPRAMKVQVAGWICEIRLLQQVKAVCSQPDITVAAIIQDLELRIGAKEALVQVANTHLKSDDG